MLFFCGLLLTAALLLYGMFLFLTSSWMVTRVYLRIGSHFARVELVAEEAEWDVFRKHLTFRNFRVGSRDFPWVEGEYLAGKYHIGDVLAGGIRWSDLTLKNGSARVLVPGSRAFSGEAPAVQPLHRMVKKPPRKKRYNWINRFDLRRLRIENCVFSYYEKNADGRRKKFELSGLNGELAMLRPKTESSLKLSGTLVVDNFNEVYISDGRFDISADGNLGNYLIPEKLSVAMRVERCRGKIGVKKLQGDTVECNFAASRTGKQGVELENFILRQYHDSRLESAMKCSGSLQRNPLKLRSDFEVKKLSPELFSLLCELLWSFNPGQVDLIGNGGFDYGEGTIAGRGKFTLSRAGAAYFNGKKLELPPFQLKSESDFTVDLEKRLANVKKVAFTLSGDTDNRKIVSVNLPEAVMYSWSDDRENRFFPVKNSQQEKLNICFDRLDLRLLRLLPFQPETANLRRGYFCADLSGNFSASGLRLDGEASIRDTSLTFDGKDIDDLNMNSRISGVLTSALTLDLENFSGVISRDKNSLGEYTGHFRRKFRGDGSWQGRIELFNVSPDIIRYLVPLDSVKSTEELLRKSGGGRGKVGVSFGRNGREGVSYLRNWNFVWENPAAGFTLQGKLSDMFFDRDFRPDRDWEGEYKLIFPADFPGRFGIRSGNYLEGMISGEGKLNFGRDFSHLSGDGRFRFGPGKLKIRNTVYDNVGWEADYSCGSSDFEEWRFSRLNLYMHVNNFSALRMEIPFVIRKNRVSGELSLRYLNENLLNLFLPGCFDGASISGALQFDCGNIARRRWSCGGNFLIDRLKFHRVDEVFSGPLSLNMKNDSNAFEITSFSGNFSRAGGKNSTRIEGSLRYPANDLRPVSGKVRFNELDGVFLRECISQALKDKTAKENKELLDSGSLPEMSAARESQPHPGGKTGKKSFEFDFGRRHWNFLFAVDRLRWDNGDLKIRSVFNGSGRNARLERLVFDTGGNSVTCDWIFRSVPGKAVEFNTTGKSSGKLPMELFLSPFVDGPGSRGEIENLRWNFTGEFSREWGDKLKGRVEADFGDTVLSNNLAGGVLGRLLFLPMEIILRLSSVVPEKITSVDSWTRSMRSAGGLESPSHKIFFDRGKLAVKITDSVLDIEEFYLAGPAVRLLSFDGTIGMGSNEKLDLQSKISLTGMDLPLSIGGTLEEPSLKLLNLLPETLGANAEKLLHLLGSIFWLE